MTSTAYSALLQMTVAGVNRLHQDEQDGKAKRKYPDTPLVFNIPWYWSERTDWKEYIKQFKNPLREIQNEEGKNKNGWRALLHEIAQTTGFGCFDERKSPQVKLMTPEEQKEDATQRIVGFVSRRIEHLKRGKLESLPGYNASDIQLLETNYPQGVPLVKFDEILRGVDSAIDPEIGTDWRKEFKVHSDYAVTRI